MSRPAMTIAIARARPLRIRCATGDDDVVRSLNAQLAEYKKIQRDAVIKHVRYEVKKREIVDDHFDAMAATRRSIADQSRKYLRELETLTDSRARLAMSCALADILRDLDDLQRGVDGWKIDQAPDREFFGRMNDGLFFKKLYDESHAAESHAAESHATESHAAVSYAAVSCAVLAIVAIACVMLR